MPPENLNPIVSQPKKKDTKFILLIILGFILIATNIYFLYKTYFVKEVVIEEQNLNTNITATTTDEFTNWKTYRNEEYGFEIQIPLNWIVDIQKGVIYLFYSPNKTVQELTFYLSNPEIQILGREEIRRINLGSLIWIVYKTEGSTDYEYELIKKNKAYVFSPDKNLDIIPILSTFKFIE